MLVALALLVASSCSSGKKAASTSTMTTTRTARAAGPPCTPAKPRPSGQSTVHITSGGIDRDYVLFVPRSYTGATAVPVVFNFHGFGSNANQQMLYGDFRPLAERDAFLIVAPI